MRLLRRPLVFVGPTLERETVERLLPGALIRPPIERGDLYRERLLGGSVFLIIDGVFPQQNSVTTQELRDVIADDGVVLGAAGLGALRAAELWMAGMLGVGVGYRALRAGSVLLSDDEVAVAPDPAAASGFTVPLLNVRWATSHLRRRGILDTAGRQRIVTAAECLFFADRRWDLILEAAEVPGNRRPELLSLLSALDLPASDAERALRHLGSRLTTDCFRLPSRPAPAPSPSVSVDDSRRNLLSWLVISGRCHRYLRSVRGARQVSLSSLDIFQGDDEDRWLARMGLGAAELGCTLDWSEWDLPDLLGRLVELGRTGERLWTELVLRGELQTERAQLEGLRLAAREARESGLCPTGEHRQEAERTIAFDHRCRDWQELAERMGPEGELHARLCAYRDELALALAARDAR